MTPAEAAAILAEAGIEQPRREVRWLAAHAAQSGCALAPLVHRRAAHEPLALVVGHQPFWTFEVKVSPHTLIPRADSESLVHAALEHAPDARRVLDLGTGTGCLLLAVLGELPLAWGLGVDLVPQAAALAAGNAGRLGIGRAAFLCCDWTAALSAARFDLVLCNPPYIDTADVPGLMPEVALFEPATALNGGADGLHCYRAVLSDIRRLLAPGARVVLELGAGQGADVAAIAAEHGLSVLGSHRDGGGVERALVLAAG